MMMNNIINQSILYKGYEWYVRADGKHYIISNNYDDVKQSFRALQRRKKRNNWNDMQIFICVDCSTRQAILYIAGSKFDNIVNLINYKDVIYQ